MTARPEKNRTPSTKKPEPAPLTHQDIQEGLKVRRAGAPRTAVGRARKAQVFEVVAVYGTPGHGYWRAKLRGDGQAFWMMTLEKWERVGRSPRKPPSPRSKTKGC